MFLIVLYFYIESIHCWIRWIALDSDSIVKSNHYNNINIKFCNYRDFNLIYWGVYYTIRLYSFLWLLYNFIYIVDIILMLSFYLINQTYQITSLIISISYPNLKTLLRNCHLIFIHLIFHSLLKNYLLVVKSKVF